MYTHYEQLKLFNDHTMDQEIYVHLIKLPLSNLIKHIILVILYCDMLFFTGTAHD